MTGSVAAGPAPPADESSPARRERLAHRARLLLGPLAALALIPVLLTELHLFPIHDLVGSAIPDTIYLEHAAQGLVQGHQPYVAGFLTSPDSHAAFVYPPLSLLLAVPPLLAGSDYSFGLALELLLLTLAGLWLLHRGCQRAGISFPVALIAGILLIALGPILVTRLDGLQGLALAGAALALRGRRAALAVALVALAVLVKETAVVAALPVLAWALWPAEGTSWQEGLGRRLGAVALGLAPAALLLLGFVVWSGGGVLHAASASLNRGVEIESVPASLSSLLRPLYPLGHYIGRLASVQVAGAEVGWVAAAVAGVGVVALIWGSVHFARAQRQPATAIAFALAVGLAASPVLSPQYLLALMPVLVLAAGTEAGRRRGNLLLLSGLGLALLTQVEFPYLFSSAASLAPLGTGLVAARNLLLIATAVNLARPDRGHAFAPTPVTVAL